MEPTDAILVAGGGHMMRLTGVFGFSLLSFWLAGCGCGGDGARCGNGAAEGKEECDDGNATDGDGCTAGCLIEFCGNGRVEGIEDCDDGNTDPFDGCDSFCREEPDAECGNGIVEAGEACDDGEANSDDEPNICRTDCSEPRCGDGIVDAGEECDDGVGDRMREGTLGNANRASQCRTSCVDPICGDAIRDFDEGCDDGDQEAGDGCDSLCFPEDVCGDDPYVNLMLDGVAVGNSIWYYGDTSGLESRFTPPDDCPGVGGAADVVHLFIASTAGRIRVTTRDPTPAGETQFDTIVYVLSECDQAVADVLACNDQYVLEEPIIDPWGPDIFEDDRAEVDLEVDAGDVIYIVVDGYDTAQSGGYALTIQHRPVRAEGEDCDLTESLDVCAEGLVCSSVPDDPGHGICSSEAAPVVVSAELRVAGEWNLVLDASGSDENADASEVRLLFRDARGGIVDRNFDGERDENDTIVLRPESSFVGLFEFDGTFFVGRDSRALTADVVIRDLRRLDSAPTSVDVPDFPPPRFEGEECDPAGLADRCEWPLACLSVGGSHECGERTCDGYVDLNDHRDGADYAYTGSTLGEPNDGSFCDWGQLTGDIGFAFTPPSSGRWRVAVEDASFSHSLSVRNDCTDAGVMDCQAGTRGVDTFLMPWLWIGVTYHIVVDGHLRGADEGSFTIRVGPPIELDTGEPCGFGIDGVCADDAECVNIPELGDDVCVETIRAGGVCDPEDPAQICDRDFSCAPGLGGRYTCQNLEFLSESCGGMWGSCLPGLACVGGQCEIAACSPIDMNAEGVLDAGANTVTYDGSTDGEDNFWRRCGWPSGQDVLLRYRVRQNARVSFDTSGSEIDTSLALSTSCTRWDSYLECNDDYGGVRSFIDAGDWSAGTNLYLLLDDNLRIAGDFRITAREIRR